MIANSARSTQISTKDLEHSRNEEGVKMRNHKRTKKNKTNLRNFTYVFLQINANTLCTKYTKHSDNPDRPVARLFVLNITPACLPK